MRFSVLVDCHTHSDHSPDGNDPIIKNCEYAERAGFYAIAVTDHCELDAYKEDKFNLSIVQSDFAARRAKIAFDGRLKVLSGTEFGQPCHNLEASKAALAARNYDFILASVHNLRGYEDFYYLDYNKFDIKNLLGKYFDEIIETIEWGHFDSLAHLTYPLRYICGEHSIEVDIAVFRDKIDDILSLLAEKEKALEINTSGLRQKLGQTLPAPDIVKRFKDLGGQFVTVGSDSHNCLDVGAGIEQGFEVAYNAGFKNVVIFENRIPQAIPLI